MTIIPSFSTRQQTASCETGATERPRSAEMTPGAGFRIRREIERPALSLGRLFRAFETSDISDISDILNRMYTMRPDIRNMVDEQPLGGPALIVKVFPGDNLMVHKALDMA